jgi:hypothetical protein
MEKNNVWIANFLISIHLRGITCVMLDPEKVNLTSIKTLQMSVEIADHLSESQAATLITLLKFAELICTLRTEDISPQMFQILHAFEMLLKTQFPQIFAEKSNIN